MTTLLRKNLDLKNLCRWRLYLKTFSKEFNTSKLTISYPKTNLVKGSNRFATAVQGVKFNNDSGNREQHFDTLSNGEGAPSKMIDNALAEVDYLVKRTGRTIKKSVENILSMIEDHGIVSSTQGLYLLRACNIMWRESPAQRVELAEQIWKKLQTLGCQFDVQHFNSFLRVYVENNYPFSPSEFLATMESHKVEPNKVTFLCLLDKYANDGNVNGASEVLQFMKDKGLPINEAVFNALIKCHMKAKDTSGARDILEVMRSSYSPTTETFTALACGYAELGETEQITSVLQEAKDNNTPLSTLDYLSIFSSLPAEHSNIVDEMIGTMHNIYEYKQEVVNCMYNLVHKDLSDTAFKLLLAIASREDTASTNSFMKLVIQLGKPIEKVINYCEKIHAQQLNEYVFINSAKAAVEFNQPDHAMALFDELYQKGIPVRVTLFWGLLTHYKNSEEGVMSTLKKMYKLGVPPDFITFEEYVFPAMNVNNPSEVISKLQETGISLMSAIDPLFQYYCHNASIHNALYLIENYPVRIYTTFNLGKFLSLYENFRSNTSSYYKILNYVMRKNKLLPETDAEVFQGEQLALFIQINPALFQKWIKRLQEEKGDIKFSQKTLETCWSILNSRAPECLVYLRAFQRNQPRRVRVLTPEEEEKELTRLKERGASTESFLIERLNHHIKEKNFDGINKMKAKLDEMEVIYPPVLYAYLLNLYCRENDLESAEKALCTLKEKYPTFKVETLKIFDLAALQIKFSKFEEAKKTITESCQEVQIFGLNDLFFQSMRRLLFAAIQTGDCDLVRSLQGSLIHLTKEFPNSTLLYEPLLRLHLNRNDIDGAVDEFRNCVLNHKVVPCLNMILRKCIVTDSHNLKTVINLARELKQESAVLYELALAFLETGRKEQAIKVVQSMNSRGNHVFIEDICNRLANQKQVAELENFLHIVSNIEHLGKEKLYYNLFKLYAERNDFKKCLDLYQWIENEKLFEPSDRMKVLLSKLLQKNGQLPPFPEVSVPTTVSSNSQDMNEFLQSVKEENTSEALEKIESMKKGILQSIPHSDISKFVELLVKEKRTTDLSHNNVAVGYIIENVNTIIKPLLEKYSTNGDVESLKEVAALIPDYALKKAYFNSYFAHAHFNSGKYEDLFCELEKNQQNKNNKLFCIAAYEGLLKNSNFVERLVKLSEGYLEQNFEFPICIIWAHYITNENYEKAEEFFKSHPISVEKVDSLVLKVVRQENNIDMGKFYIEAVNQQNARLRSKERAYGTLLDILVLKGLHDDAVALFTEAKQKGIDLEKYNRSTLIALKSALEGDKKEVPFTIASERSFVTG